jgi:hypothetical protein
LAKANPARVEVSTTLSVTTDATISELPTPLKKCTSSFCRTRPKFSQKCPPAVTGGVGSLIESWLRVPMMKM